MNDAPVKDDVAIARRLAIVTEDLQTMQDKAAFLGMQGGPHPIFRTVEFHQGRKDLLVWMLTASAEAIDAKRAELEDALGAGSVFKYSQVHDLPDELAAKIAHVEILEYGLGLHPIQVRRRA